MEKKCNFTKDDIQAMKELHECGYTYREIAKKFGTSGENVYYHTTKDLEKPKNPKIRPLEPEKVAKIVDLHKEGYSITEISQKLKTSRTTARKYIKRKDSGEGRKTKHECTRRDCKYHDRSAGHWCTCNYILVTGRRRGCPVWDCVKYEKGTI